MKVVNFLAGPCSGKSTLSYGVTHLMKSAGINVDYDYGIRGLVEKIMRK